MFRTLLFELPHIKFALTDREELVLVIEDTELNDFIIDYLWDNYQIESSAVDWLQQINPTINLTYYDSAKHFVIIDALKKLNINEIQKIYQINN
jgi:hypothetical protein